MRTPGVPERQERAPVPEAPAAVAAPMPVARVLRWQESVGNAAVSSVLNRQPVEAPSRPMVRRGSRGPAVSDVQARLNTAEPPAAPPLVVDGIFGPLTRGATVTFQQSAGLVPDGIVGPLTHAALDARRGGPGPVPPTPGQLTPEQEADALDFNATYD